MKHLGGPLLTQRLFIFILLLLSLVLTAGAARSVNGEGRRTSGFSRAGLVVDMGDGTTLTRCVTFSEEEISGLDLLERSGLEVVTNRDVVCAIEGTGCPDSNCWCQCQGTPCVYWTYWHWRDGAWQYSQAGAAGYRVRDGDVEGWRWGAGDSPSVSISFEQVCFPFRIFLPVVSRGWSPSFSERLQ